MIIHTCLPLFDNEKNDIAMVVGATLVELSMHCSGLTVQRGHGVWVSEAGIQVAEPVLFVSMCSGLGPLIESVLRGYKKLARQESVVVTNSQTKIHDGNAYSVPGFCAAFGGCTTVNEKAFAFENATFL